MTVAQHAAMSRLCDGAVLRDSGVCRYEIDGRGPVLCLTLQSFQRFVDRGWICSSGTRGEYEITEAGKAAYEHSTID